MSGSQKVPNKHSLKSAILGCLVADAAALGLHWLYDRAALDKAVAGLSAELNEAAFSAITPVPYQNKAGYFAHAGKSTGDLSQYGEAVLFWLECRLLNDLHTLPSWQAAFIAHFGPGGAFVGYADRPTRDAVNLLLNKPKDTAEQTYPSGCPIDDQNPVFNSMLAAVALGESARPMALTTHQLDLALQYSDAMQAALMHAISGGNSADVISVITPLLPDAAQDTLANLADCGTDREAMAACTSTACHLPASVPLALHILRECKSFKEAIELNIRLGGDSCGRAMSLGPLAGAIYGLEGIPSHWMMSLNEHHRIAKVLSKL